MDDQLITDLMRRERKRREALWQLSSPLKQEQAIQDLIEIERLDMTLPLGEAAGWTVEQVGDHVPVGPRADDPKGLAIVAESSIPEPWRSRMAAASRGSTCVAEGYFAQDWQKFLRIWTDECSQVEILLGRNGVTRNRGN